MRSRSRMSVSARCAPSIGSVMIRHPRGWSSALYFSAAVNSTDSTAARASGSVRSASITFARGSDP